MSLRHAVLACCVLLAARLEAASAPGPDRPDVVVVISADAEWRALSAARPAGARSASPFGEWFATTLSVAGRPRKVVFFHGGWGKVSAAASAQYLIDRWRPGLLVNLGTCGGFDGAIAKGEVILVEKTIVYDIVEQMGDSAEALAHYATEIDLSWVGTALPKRVRRGPLLSADRDIVASEIPRLRQAFGGIAADWESGAIAWVARANATPVLILRGVSDLVGEAGGEAYGSPEVFEAGTGRVMKELLDQLPFWLARWDGRGARPARR